MWYNLLSAGFVQTETLCSTVLLPHLHSIRWQIAFWLLTLFLEQHFNLICFNLYLKMNNKSEKAPFFLNMVLIFLHIDLKTSSPSSPLSLPYIEWQHANNLQIAQNNHSWWIYNDPDPLTTQSHKHKHGHAAHSMNLTVILHTQVNQEKTKWSFLSSHLGEIILFSVPHHTVSITTVTIRPLLHCCRLICTLFVPQFVTWIS